MNTSDQLERGYLLMADNIGRVPLDAFAVDAHGDKTSPLCPSAVGFCSVGALVRIQNPPEDQRSAEPASRMRRIEAKAINRAMQSAAYDWLTLAALRHGYRSLFDADRTADLNVLARIWSEALLMALVEESTV